MNSEEIARLAKVSRSTVSRVINNYKNVPPETREKVQKIIAEYGYVPNTSARTLAGKSNNIIGVFIADINKTNSPGKWIGAKSPYNMELLSYVISSCKRRGYLTLVNTITDLKECNDMEQYFQNRMLFGGIFIGFPYRTRELEALAAKEYNIVLIDQLTAEDDKKQTLKLLNSDDFMGGCMATEYLLKNGHKKLVHVTGDNRLSSYERERGFLHTVKEAGLKKKEYEVIRGEYREDVAYKEMKKLLEQFTPDAAFVANDIMAIGVLRAVREKGFKVPEDISIVGYDRLEAAGLTERNLTSIGVSMEEMGEKSVAMLFAKEKSRHELCIPQLAVRKSVQQK